VSGVQRPVICGETPLERETDVRTKASNVRTCERVVGSRHRKLGPRSSIAHVRADCGIESERIGARRSIAHPFNSASQKIVVRILL
jgi:hypothetical protein